MDSTAIAEQFASIEFLFTRLQRSHEQPRIDLHQHFKDESLFYLYCGEDFDTFFKAFLDRSFDKRPNSIEVNLVIQAKGRYHSFATFVFPFGESPVACFKPEYMGIDQVPSNENAANLSNLSLWYEGLLAPISKKSYKLALFAMRPDTIGYALAQVGTRPDMQSLISHMQKGAQGHE